ncbi:WD repeat-containing protein 88 isoform X3 [Acinonyx jubatus]|uniref:WD repeat-containing protein 88 isoform X3 n=1 Tax=Acinonyx jubatus TaxID=32536 RepID=A0ABM3P2P1_ACIJB|nr:WD repeat-containing protein 88 isoform X3 [Acinonyx jubatus]
MLWNIHPVFFYLWGCYPIGGDIRSLLLSLTLGHISPSYSHMRPRLQQLHLNSCMAHSRSSDHVSLVHVRWVRHEPLRRPRAHTNRPGTGSQGEPKESPGVGAARFTCLASFLLCPGPEPRFSGSKRVPRGGEATRSQREGEGVAFPGSGRGAQARGATVRSWPGRGAGCRQPSGWGSEMASEPPCAPGSPEAPDKGKKTVSQQCEVQPPLVPSGDIEHPPQKLPRAALVRGYGRFRLSIVEARQGQLLSRLDPLEVGKRSLPSEKRSMPEEKFWGDQESLSKIPFKIMKGHSHIVSSCNFCVDDTKLLSGSYDCTVKLWDAVDGSVIRDFEHRPNAPVLECSVTADSKRIIAASYDKAVRAWDLETGKLLWKINHETFIASCKLSPDGKYVVSALDVDRGICITDAENATTVSHIKTSFLVSGGLDRTVAIWDVGEGYRKLSLKGHSDWVTDVAISNDKKRVLSSSKDRTMRLWNIEEIDQIPLVIKYKKALGSKVKQCEVCDRPFSIYESDIFSETVTKCVFCRMDAKDLSAEASSSSGGEAHWQGSAALPQMTDGHWAC